MKLLNKIILSTLILTMCVSITAKAYPALYPDTICIPSDYCDDADKIDEFL